MDQETIGKKRLVSMDSTFIYGDSSGLKIEIEMRKYDDGSIHRTLLVYEDELGVITTTTRRVL